MCLWEQGVEKEREPVRERKRERLYVCGMLVTVVVCLLHKKYDNRARSK